jgi:hypothetical protein
MDWRTVTVTVSHSHSLRPCNVKQSSQSLLQMEQWHWYSLAKHEYKPIGQYKLSLCLIKHYAMKTYGGVDV